MTLLNTSRAMWSVPKKWRKSGGVSRVVLSDNSGSYGLINGAEIATRTAAKSISAPTAPSGFDFTTSRDFTLLLRPGMKSWRMARVMSLRSPRTSRVP